MRIRKKQKGFSLVELMMLLLVSSLIIAALVPVVTKKHFRLPSTVIHGAYMCYYKNGELWEAKWSGKTQQKVVFDRPTDQCVFVPPQKAAFFQISAIGGGGGGGDAGYTGGNPEEGWGGTTKIPPFNFTEDKLEGLNMSKGEFLAHAGSLWGYARGGSSGAGAAIGYAVKNQAGSQCLEYEKIPEQVCVEWYPATEDVSVTTCVPKTEEEGAGEGEGEGTGETTGSNNVFTRIASSVSKFFKSNIAHNIKGYITGAADSTTTTEDALCPGTVQVPKEVCYYHDELVEEKTCYTTPEKQCSKTQETCVNVDKVKQETKTRMVDRQGFEITCRSGSSCSSTAITGDQSDGCRTTGTCTYQVPEQYTEEVHYTERECDTECVSWITPPGEPYDCSTYRSILDGCETISVTEEQMVACTCTTETTPGHDAYCAKEETQYKEGACIKSVPIYSYSLQMSQGNPGASGSECAGPEVKGGFGLTNDYNTTAYDGSNGEPDSDTTLQGGYFGTHGSWALDGGAPCIGVQKRECEPDKVSYSYYNIIKDGVDYAVRANSASAAGGGGGRDCTENPETGECEDYAVTSTKQAVAGSCESDSGLGACGSGNIGYCLKHHDGTIEANGMYSHEYSYDNNYLNYGEHGTPGEFKTVIVRSLKDVDTTIKVGRGGSAAAFNLGQKGANGSPTSMGNLILAQGGEGGNGGIHAPSKVLDKYDHETYLKEQACFKKLVDGQVPAECRGIEYKFHIINGRTAGELPTPVGFASSIMNFVFNTVDNSEAIQKFVKYGRGGSGGGVEHRCWAGRYEVKFDGKLMCDKSVFPNIADAAQCPGAVEQHRYVPKDCRDDWDNIPASPGADGALLIKW